LLIFAEIVIVTISTLAKAWLGFACNASAACGANAAGAKFIFCYKLRVTAKTSILNLVRGWIAIAWKAAATFWITTKARFTV